MVLPRYLFWSAIIRFGVDGEATFSQLSRNAATRSGQIRSSPPDKEKSIDRPCHPDYKQY